MGNSIQLTMARQMIPGWSRGALPVVDGEFCCDSLQDKVEIRRDEFGIPHIYASCINDLLTAQAYVHAQDRFWQMDMARRLAKGELSELLGDASLDVDKFARVVGWRRTAELDYKDICENKPESLEQLKAYAAGVNYYLSNPRFVPPVECRLLGNTKPDPWTVLDTLCIARLMCYKLSYGWEHEIVRSRLMNLIGEHHKHWDLDDPESPPTITEECVKNLDIKLDELWSSVNIKNAPDLGLSQSQGSNCWVVHGSRTDTGSPILSNDCHLAFTIPNTFYENHLICDEKDIHVTGVSVAGLPFVSIGHNQYCAWGVTLGYADTQDIYVERFMDPESSEYEVDGKRETAQIIEETIRVKGKDEPESFKVYVTRHGPILNKEKLAGSDEVQSSKMVWSAEETKSDSELTSTPDYRLALCSNLVSPGLDVMSAMRTLNLVQNPEQFCAAVDKFIAPSLNMPYADIHGNIGYYLIGKVPQRPQGNNGLLPTAGWTSSHDWGDNIPHEHMPHTINPKTGFVVSCNHRVVPENYPYNLGGIWRQGYRARVVEEELKQNSKVSSEFCAKLHNNVRCIPGEEVMALIRNADLQLDDARHQDAWKYLLDWDFQLTTQSVGGAIFMVLQHNMTQNIIKRGLKEGMKENGHQVEEVPQELMDLILGHSFNPAISTSGNSFKCRTEKSITRILEDDNGWWLQQSGGKSKLVRESLAETVKFLEERFGSDISNWTWGNVHQLRVDHSFSRKFGPEPFSRGNFQIGGSPTTVKACSVSLESEDKHSLKGMPAGKTGGVVYRQIIDMGDLANAKAWTFMGQSGHLQSEHYDDQLKMLLVEGEYHRMLWNREDVEENTQHKLLLGPNYPQRPEKEESKLLQYSFVAAAVAAIAVGVALRLRR